MVIKLKKAIVLGEGKEKIHGITDGDKIEKGDCKSPDPTIYSSVRPGKYEFGVSIA